MNSSLTKLDLNNQIVNMRHNVRRAKVQTLNKLCRHIKRLRNKKAVDTLKKKNEEKANRLYNEVLVMKKIPLDEVAAFSLTNSKKVDDILSDVDSSSRLTALARLSVHKSIQPVVQHFRLKYPNWKNELPKVLVALKNRTKLKSDDITSKNKKKQKNSNKNVSNQKSNKSGNNSKWNEEINDDSMNSFDSENDDLSNSCSLLSESFIESKGNRFSICSDDSEISHSSQKQSKSKTSDSNISSSDKNKSFMIEKIVDSSCIDNLNISQSSERVEGYQNKNLNKNNQSFNKNLRKNLDPFFIGNNNEEYETSNPVSTIDDYEMKQFESKNMYFDEDKRTSNKFKFNKKQNDFKNKDKTNSNSFRNFERKSNMNEKVKRFEKEKIIRKGVNKISEKINHDIPVTLHPSWEAKKKVSNIVPFAGKKIVF